MELRKKALALVERSIDRSSQRRNVETDALRSEVEQLKSYLSTATRHKQEFFGLIERIEQQRDEWREMFKRSSMEQLTALNMVDRALSSERRKLAAVVKLLNEYLEKDGKPLLDESQLPSECTPPAGEYKQYAKSMMELFTAGVPESVGRAMGVHRPEDIDGRAEREKIAR
jgi:sugar-specific transcriptional regulator TrmB